MYQFRLMRATRDRWLETNYTLGAGEPGFEMDTNKLKIGNGYAAWSDLPYVVDESVIALAIQEALNDATGDNPPAWAPALIEAHVLSPEPHPVYDDLQSLSLLFENGLT